MRGTDYRIGIVVEAQVHPSEDENKVKSAISTIFGPMNLGFSQGLITGGTDDPKALQNFAEQTRSRKSLGVLRKLLTSHKGKNSTWVYLNKQAAFVGVVTICEESMESPLGPIKLTMNSADIDDLIQLLSSF